MLALSRTCTCTSGVSKPWLQREQRRALLTLRHATGIQGETLDEPLTSRRLLLTGAVTPGLIATFLERVKPAEAAAAVQVSPLTTSAPCPPPALNGGPQVGVSALREPFINRGLAMSSADRDLYKMQGLLPPGQSNISTEVLRAKAALKLACTPLAKYSALMLLRETNTQCFYSLLQEDLEELLPTLYTPTVGDACLAWGSLLPRPTGLYISYDQHRDRLKEVVAAWPESQVKIAVITDGNRILGLGDLGAHGMGIPVGKATVYGACGVDPRWILPVQVDVGCNTASVRDDHLYLGDRRSRLPDEEYYPFMHQVVQAIQERYGFGTLMHWEDVSSKHSFGLLELLRAAEVTTFNDDIEATAVISLAALLGAVKVPGVAPLTEQRVLFFGAGQANLGCAALLCAAMEQAGLTPEQARQRVWLLDSKGLLLTSRSDLSADKKLQARDPAFLPGGAPVTGDLLAAVKAVQPTTLIGAASRGGAFTQAVVKALTQATQGQGWERPVVFALSNPTSQSECTYEQAYGWTDGKVVFASGTRFPNLQVSDTIVRAPSQANNCYVFSGIGLGVVASGASTITPSMMLAAAQAVADAVPEEDIRVRESVLPPLNQLGEVTVKVATAVAQAAAVDMVASPTSAVAAACMPAWSAVGQAREKGATGGARLEACIRGLLFDPSQL